MGRITFVRHGQASFMSDDYDRLSPIGVQQSALLGAYWAQRGRRFAAVYSGTLRRHRQTYDAFAEAYATHGVALPQPQPLAAFDEHQGFQLTQALLPLLADSDPLIAAHYDPQQPLDGRTYLKLFRHIMLQWADGTLNHPDIDTWAGFRRRVEGGVDLVRPAASGENDVLVFTSGGTIGAVVGYALALSGRHTMGINFTVRNTAYVDFVVRDDLFALLEFNAIPHLDDASLHTVV